MSRKNNFKNIWLAGRKTLLPFLLFLTLPLFSFRLQKQTEEYSVKAAFIYKFTNYIDWDSLIPGNEFTIGIVGSSPVTDELAELAKAKTVNDKKIVIRQFNKPDEISTCNILFISQTSPLSLNEILTKLSGKGTLTISETPGYAAQGTDINFVIVDDKLKFEANPKAINSAGLKASSQLLRLAIIVD